MVMRRAGVVILAMVVLSFCLSAAFPMAADASCGGSDSSARICGPSVASDFPGPLAPPQVLLFDPGPMGGPYYTPRGVAPSRPLQGHQDPFPPRAPPSSLS